MPNTLSISRRNFARMIGAGAACVVTRPVISIAAPAVSYLSSSITPRSPETAGVVRLNSNENPYGPSPMAIKAMLIVGVVFALTYLVSYRRYSRKSDGCVK